MAMEPYCPMWLTYLARSTRGFALEQSVGSGGRRGPPIPADGFTAYLEPRSAEHLRDLGTTSDVEGIEHRNQALDDIVVAAQRRSRPDERSNGLLLRLGQRLAFPTPFP